MLLSPSPNTIKKIFNDFLLQLVINPVFPMVLYIYDDHIKMFKQYLISKNLRILDNLSLDQPNDSRRLRVLLKKPSSFLRFVMDPIPRFTGGGKLYLALLSTLSDYSLHYVRVYLATLVHGPGLSPPQHTVLR